MDFQERFNRLEQEIRDLKTAQIKPSTIQPYVAQTPLTTTPTTYTITFANSDDGYNPLVLPILSNAWLGAYDSTTNTQTVTTTATGSYTVTVVSNRQILSIA